MAINEAFHVPHVTVTDLDGVSIKDFAQSMAFDKMHVDQLQEFLAHICLYGFAVRGLNNKMLRCLDFSCSFLCLY